MALGWGLLHIYTSALSGLASFEQGLWTCFVAVAIMPSLFVVLIHGAIDRLGCILVVMLSHLLTTRISLSESSPGADVCSGPCSTQGCTYTTADLHQTVKRSMVNSAIRS